MNRWPEDMGGVKGGGREQVTRVSLCSGIVWLAGQRRDTGSISDDRWAAGRVPRHCHDKGLVWEVRYEVKDVGHNAQLLSKEGKVARTCQIGFPRADVTASPLGAAIGAQPLLDEIKTLRFPNR